MNSVLTSRLSYLIFVCSLSKHPTSRCLQLYSLTTVNNEVPLCVISPQVVTAVNKYVYIIPTIGVYLTENRVSKYSNTESTNGV
jgi:hypothetical protein